MRLLDRRAQLVAADVHIRLVRRRTLVSPVIHQLLSVVSSGQFMHLGKRARAAFKIRSGHIDLGARHLAGIDALFNFEIGVRLHASRGAHGRNTGSQISRGAV